MNPNAIKSVIIKHLSGREYSAALGKLNSSLKESDTDWELFFLLGKTYEYGFENHDKAISCFKAALKINNSNAHIFFEMGKSYKKNKDFEKAADAFKKAEKEGFGKEGIYEELSWTYYANNQPNLAVKEHKKLLDLTPEKNKFQRNRLKNEIEYFNNKTILDSKIRRLRVCLTTHCNIRCIMCSVHENPWFIPAKTVNEIIKYFPYMEYVQWLGGEVFLHKEFENIFDRAIKHPNLRQMINTNGLLLDDMWIDKLVRNNVALDISIDGTTKEVYEKIRKGAKFSELLTVLKKIKSARKKYENENFFITINFTVMKSNYRQVRDIIKFAKEYDIEVVYLNPVQGISGPENIFNNQTAPALNYISKAIPEIKNISRETGVTLHNLLPEYKKPDVDSYPEVSPKKIEAAGMQKKHINCCLPWQQLFIHDGGRVKPDCICLKEIGNIKDSSLKELWNNNAMVKYRQRVLGINNSDLCSRRCITGSIGENHLGYGA